MKRILLGMALLCLCAGFALGQRTVSGKVTGDQGEGLIGVTVTAPGTNAGTQTDINGDFRLNVSENAAALRFTYTGYMT
ncbi:MAG TPA: carboxypeptidase-like regulatory domain-containing protein, partial [Saprospiraceae bacterium]|nr:carboxypeptidase-like regulatory domain-containing protein [Saprospiraceae bacterium]